MSTVQKLILNDDLFELYNYEIKYSPVEKEALLYYRKDESMMAELIPSTFFIYLDLGCSTSDNNSFRICL